MKGNKKVINAWAMYDWANSVYPLVITTAIFPMFYEAVTEERMQFFGKWFYDSEIYSYVGTASFLIVSFLVPLLSGLADYTGNKRLFLRIFCYIGAINCMLLFFFDPSYFELSMLPFLLAGIGFWGSIVFYNSFLPDIAEKEHHDQISAKGYSLGYLGSSILLILNLILIMVFEMPAKYAFLTVGIWWILFSHITLIHLPKGVSRGKPNSSVFFRGLKEFKLVFLEFLQLKRLKRYLSAYFIYSMGVQTIMFMATLFAAKEIDWGEDGAAKTGLIVSVLIIQFIAIGGAYISAWLSRVTSNITALKIIMVVWVLVCVLAFFIHKPIEFYGVAALVGLVMGGVQSLSRSTYSKFLPPTKDTASYFTFYDVLEKIGIVIGTLSFGFVNGLTGSMRATIFVLGAYFLVGMFLLFFVPKKEVTLSTE